MPTTPMVPAINKVRSSMTPSQKAASEPIPADKIGAAKTIL
jgi:hypothetical protein